MTSFSNQPKCAIHSRLCHVTWQICVVSTHPLYTYRHTDTDRDPENFFLDGSLPEMPCRLGGSNCCCVQQSVTGTLRLNPPLFLTAFEEFLFHVPLQHKLLCLWKQGLLLSHSFDSHDLFQSLAVAWLFLKKEIQLCLWRDKWKRFIYPKERDKLYITISRWRRSLRFKLDFSIIYTFL